MGQLRLRSLRSNRGLLLARYLRSNHFKTDYILTFEKEIKDSNMLKLIVEDRINRYDLRFINPQLDKNNNDILYAQGEKGMFATGAELNMEILQAESLDKGENSIVRIHVFKKKKNIFKDDIMISRGDTDRLRRYLRENF
jgi:hypothetical protein